MTVRQFKKSGQQDKKPNISHPGSTEGSWVISYPALKECITQDQFGLLSKKYP